MTFENTRRHGSGRIIVEIALVVVMIIVVIPIAWMVLLSFLPNRAIVSHEWIFPFWIGNFQAVFEAGVFFVQMLNSIGIVIGTVLICITIGSISGYALSKLAPPKWVRIPALVISAVIPLIPPATLVPGLYLLLNSIGLLGTVPGLILVNSLFNLPFATLLMASYFSGLPMQLREAALVDGATESEAFVRVMFPLVRPGVAATSIFVAIMAWNEFLMGLTMTSGGNTSPITVGIAGFVQEYAVTWGELAAAGTVAAVPLIVVAVFANRQIISGLTAGAVKG